MCVCTCGRLRLPDWPELEEVSCAVNGEERTLSFAGRHAQVGGTVARDTVIIRFPIGEQTRFVNIMTRKYRLTLRGHDVVDIDPPGKLGPLYQRERYRNDAVAWQKRERFAPERQLYW